MSGPRLYPHRNHVMVAGVLPLIAIVTGLIYMQRPTPYTMMLWLTVGQALFVAGAALFIYVLIKDVREQVRNVATMQFGTGDVIVRQGEPAERIHVIKSGEVEFHRSGPDGTDQVLGRLGPEMHFGEVAVLSDEGYGVTAIAVTEVETLAVHRDSFDHVYRAVPFMRAGIDAEVERKMQTLGDKFVGQDE